MGAGMAKIQREEEKMDKEGYGGGRATEQAPKPPPPPKPVVINPIKALGQNPLSMPQLPQRQVGLSPLHY